MKKSTLLMTLALILSITLGIGGTMAYLSDTDEDVNVMTLGNVKIDQIEKERVEQTNSGKDELQDYTQGKPLYPAVGDEAWVESDNGRVYQEWPTGGSSALFDTEKLQNEHDKIVFVENTGKSDAYVRTIFAFEAGDLTAETINNKLMHWNRNATHWTWTDFSEDMATTIDGVKYYLRVATYTGTETVHPGGILPAGETTRPSLLQLFLDKTADNELCESFGDTYDVLVVSQAVQTMGFNNAEEALNEAFGEITAEKNPWLNGETGKLTTVSSAEELTAVLKNAQPGDTVVLAAGEYDLDANGALAAADGVTIVGSEGTKITNVGGDAIRATMKDVTLAGMTIGGRNGLRYCYANGTVVLENCTIEGDVYGVHFDGGTGDVIIRNCDIKGWNSFGSKLNSVTFENCSFGKTNYGCIRFYQDAVVKNCTFAEDLSWIDAAASDINITFQNNTYEKEGASVTDLIFLYNAPTNVVWTVDGVELTEIPAH